jgi:hypothetical protein
MLTSRSSWGCHSSTSVATAAASPPLPDNIAS